MTIDSKILLIGKRGNRSDILENGAEQPRRLVDPKLRILRYRVTTGTTTTGSFVNHVIIFGKTQRAGLMNLCLVKSESEQGSSCIPLRRRQEWRRGHHFESQFDQCNLLGCKIWHFLGLGGHSVCNRGLDD